MTKNLGRSALAMFLAVGLVVGIPAPVSAELVSTAQALALEDGGEARVVVDAWLARDQVAQKLRALGVDPEMVRLRVSSLSDSEIAELAQNIEQAPAGGNGVLAVLGVTFLVLLILELVGVIDIFKKT